VKPSLFQDAAKGSQAPAHAPAALEPAHRRSDNTPLILLGVSLALAGALVVLGVLTASRVSVAGLPPHRAIDFFALAALAALGPYGFYMAHQRSRLKKIESRLPDLLRELASSHRAGLTLPRAVSVAASGDYGALTPEVRRMAAQLEWTIPFPDVLAMFRERVPTKFVARAVTLITEAMRLGSNVSDVLLVAARDARETKALERQRSLTMGLYTGVVYIAFFVFLVVVMVLYGTLIGQLVRAAAATQGLPVSGLGFQAVSLESYRTFYFVGALSQAIGNGILAGLIESGSWVGGLRHAFVMVLVTVIAFVFVLK
jgi:archaeal flagellar protein FlaJ